MKYFLIIFFTALVQASSEKTIESNILQIENEIAEVYSKITANNQEIASAKKKISSLNQNIDSKKKYLAKRLLAQKNIKTMSWFLALDAKNKITLDRNLKIFKKINSSDLTALYEYKLALEDVKSQEKLLESENKKLKELTKYLQVQEEKLKTAETEQKALLADISNADHLLNHKGKLSLPMRSRILEEYGSLHDSENQYAMLVKGLVFESAGKQVVSAFGPGKVIFRDHVPYWGDSLIISHKGGYYSVYAGVEKALVKVNDFVQNEQSIAYTGEKEFYFELRHLNIPLNPLNWIRKDND